MNAPPTSPSRPGSASATTSCSLEIASGGTATVGIAVYRGAAGFERLVVVKRVHRQLTKDREFTAMLIDEARLASSVRHPNVVPVIDVLRIDDEVVLVMDYVDSVPLSQLLGEAARSSNELPLPVVSRIARRLARRACTRRTRPSTCAGSRWASCTATSAPRTCSSGVDGIARVIDFGIAKARSRIAHDARGRHQGQVRVHGARAGGWAAGGPAVRRLRRGHRALGGADRRAPFPRRRTSSTRCGA